MNNTLQIATAIHRSESALRREPIDPPEPAQDATILTQCDPAAEEAFIRDNAGDIACELEEATTDAACVAFVRKWRAAIRRECCGREEQVYPIRSHQPPAMRPMTRDEAEVIAMAIGEEPERWDGRDANDQSWR